jgi:serologically defined colon cancer antigen 8
MIEQLKCEIRRCEQKYEARGARQEDVEQIQSLQVSLEEKAKALAKMVLELKHYQNELLNRESSYNKMFTSKPSRAVLNVIETRVKREGLLVETQLPRSLPSLRAEAVGPRAESATTRQLLPVVQKRNTRRLVVTSRK